MKIHYEIFWNINEMVSRTTEWPHVQAQENTTLVREEVTDAERRCEEKQLKQLWKRNFKEKKGLPGTKHIQAESLQMSLHVTALCGWNWLNWKQMEVTQPEYPSLESLKRWSCRKLALPWERSVLPVLMRSPRHWRQQLSRHQLASSPQLWDSFSKCFYIKLKYYKQIGMIWNVFVWSLLEEVNHKCRTLNES